MAGIWGLLSVSSGCPYAFVPMFCLCVNNISYPKEHYSRLQNPQAICGINTSNEADKYRQEIGNGANVLSVRLQLFTFG